MQHPLEMSYALYFDEHCKVEQNALKLLTDLYFLGWLFETKLNK